MTNIIISDPKEISLSRDIKPLAKQHLKKHGWVVISPTFILQENENIIESYFHAFLTGCGFFLGKRRIGYYKIESSNNYGSELSLHTESIYHPIIPSFIAIACINNLASGGETNVYDARKAAAHLLKEDERIARTVIEYRSGAYLNLPPCSRKIIESDREHGKVLRFRAGFAQKKYKKLPSHLSKEEAENRITVAAKKSIVYSHVWKKGDILLINNRNTLHGRSSYKGKRTMLRVRYGDYTNGIIKL